MLNLIKIFKKTLSLVKIFENVDFGKKNFEKFRFWSIFMKISSLVKIYKNIDFGQNFRSLDFGQNCPNISNMIKIIEKSRFLSKLSKI